MSGEPAAPRARRTDLEAVIIGLAQMGATVQFKAQDVTEPVLQAIVARAEVVDQVDLPLRNLDTWPDRLYETWRRVQEHLPQQQAN